MLGTGIIYPAHMLANLVKNQVICHITPTKSTKLYTLFAL